MRKPAAKRLRTVVCQLWNTESALLERKIIELNCWLGRRWAARVFCSMRPAKLPAAFCCRSVIVVEEFAKVLVMVPLVTSGTVVDATPDGHPVPSGLHDFDRFDCIAVNEDKIGDALIWLRSVWL